MKKAIKISMLFVGAVIGAGFASGKEISTFFGGISPISATLSGFYIALLLMLFMFHGKKSTQKNNIFYNFLILLASVVSVSAMLSASQSLFEMWFSFPLSSLFFGFLSSLIVYFGINKIKIANVLAVPAIIVIIIVIFSKEPTLTTGSPSFLHPLAYSMMNLFLVSDLAEKEGKDASTKEIVLSTIITGVSLSLMIFLIHQLVNGMQTEMPLLDISKKFHIEDICAILMLLAVFTTLVSSQKVLIDTMSQEFSTQQKSNRFKQVSLLLLSLILSYPLSFWGFDNIVNNLYPMVSACGFLSVIKLFFEELNQKIHIFFVFKNFNSNSRFHQHLLKFQNLLRCHRLRHDTRNHHLDSQHHNHLHN